MFEGYIASKFADKYFEEDIFKIIKRHAIVVAILSWIPDLGIIYAVGLWRMYVKIANKCGISFMENFGKLAGVGMIVNIVVYIAYDTALTIFPFFTPILAYIQFYLSGKLYVESIKKLPINH